MNVDIFDSMAQAVSNAAVVIAFISQRYQVRMSLYFARLSTPLLLFRLSLGL